MKTPLAILLCLLTAFAFQAAGQPEAQPTDGALFGRVSPTLDEALDLIDRHEGLPKRTLLFGEDQRSNRRKIDALLDQAIAALGISQLGEKRDQVRAIQAAIREAHERIAEAQRRRLAAPVEDTQGLLDRANPFSRTREDYDELIAAERKNIEAWQEDLGRLRTEFAQSLRTVGLDLDDQAVESLLSSVTGDDVVTMAIVFDNVRRITDQLETLTQQSGEALDAARRYYGMYVVLVEVLDRIQSQFIEDVRDRHIPSLERYIDHAQRNIDQAQRLIRREGGDRKVLEANIEANRLTQQTARLYIDYLKQQAAMVETENRDVSRMLATARNTYQTVKLSSDLAELMKAGRETFQTLMRLRLPYLREFRNETIRREFQRMTEQLRAGQ